MLEYIIFFLAFVTAIYLYIKWEGDYFNRNGIRSLPYTFPMIGNIYKVMARKESFKDMVTKLYVAFPTQKYAGHTQIGQHIIVIRDVELIKKIAIKDFDSFQDHQHIITERSDPIFGNGLFVLKGKKWREMRASMSPVFTTSKMKNMLEFVDNCGSRMVEFYKERMKKPENKERGLVEIELKDCFTKYASNVIGSAGFGMVIDTYEEEDNELYRMGSEAANFSGSQQFKFFLFGFFPRFAALLSSITGLSILSKRAADYFRSLVLGTMEYRKKHGIVRKDMIHLLMEAKQGLLNHEKSNDKDTGFATVEESSMLENTNRKWKDDEIVAQVAFFFIGGFDTVSTALSFLAYEIALHRDVQDKLFEEINSIATNNEDKLNYEDLSKMKYMDMVVSETLRKWPPVLVLDRECVKPYTLPPPCSSSSKGYTMEKKQIVWFPVYAIQNDKQYYPNPEKFDPERFSEENKSKINQDAYLPFGIGPRNCIGSRFALMKSKAMLYHLIKNFKLVTTAKTENPISFSIDSFNFQATNGYWIGLQPRN